MKAMTSKPFSARIAQHGYAARRPVDHTTPLEPTEWFYLIADALVEADDPVGITHTVQTSANARCTAGRADMRSW